MTQVSYRTIQVAPIAGALGAEVSGVDLGNDLAPETVQEIRHAWLEHLVVFFRDQHLEPEAFLAFARRIGDPVAYPFVKGIDRCPEIIAVTKLPDETVNFGGIWHSDTVYLDRPPMGTLLLAREVPPVGGDTLFANMYAAYEACSPALRHVLDGLRAVNTSALADVSKTREDRIRDGGQELASEFVSEHPVVRTHPETGRKTLFVNGNWTTRIRELGLDESDHVLALLFDHVKSPTLQCRFRWTPGAVAFWDNRAVQHFASPDYDERRLMHRVLLAG